MISEVHLLDRMKFLRSFPDRFFDLAIDDPPFGIGATWSKSTRDVFYKKGKDASYQNEKAPGAAYFKLLRQKSKHQIIWGGNYFTRFLPVTNAWIIWDKVRDAELQFMSEAELAWTSFKKVMRVAEFAWNGAVKCEVVTKIHPHQKPVKLYKWCLQKYAKPGWKIVDCHAGSGSSRIAAFDLGFDYYACESDKHYYQQQAERFERHRKQLQMFAPSIPQSEQLTFLQS